MPVGSPHRTGDVRRVRGPGGHIKIALTHYGESLQVDSQDIRRVIPGHAATLDKEIRLRRRKNLWQTFLFLVFSSQPTAKDYRPLAGPLENRPGGKTVMSIHAGYKSLFCCLLACLVTVACSSLWSDYTYDVHVDVDYYIVNARQDEIMVKDHEGERGIVGFFLAPGEAYHFGHHKDVDVRFNHESIEQSDLEGLNLTFYFYAAGHEGRFDEYLGAHQFVPYLDENKSFLDTFFVQ